MLFRAYVVTGVLFFVSGALYSDAYYVNPGPAVIATKGAIWPQPETVDTSSRYFLADCKNIEFQVLQYTCPLLQETIRRYQQIIGSTCRSYSSIHHYIFISQRENDANCLGTLTSVEVKLTKSCGDEWPSLSMDESYSLNVLATNNKVSLESASIWGIMRGMESFSQLMYSLDSNTGLVAINETTIVDSPRFAHRGLMLDTSRHYLSVSTILLMLDAMSYNKLNVFHWHIVDDQSFPYESKAFPQLSEKGAYHPKFVYTPSDVQHIIQYARYRGIRVMVEFDTPGHTRSWGEGIPKLLTTCYDGNKPNGQYGPIDPSKGTTYDFLNKFFKEVVSVFPEEYVHLGGDEVDYDCWESNPFIKSFMNSHNISAYNELEEYYIQKLVNIIDDLKSGSVVWEEVFVNGVQLPKKTVVHVWKDSTAMSVLRDVTKAGFPALLSACWYLDDISVGGDWQKYYRCEPYNFKGTTEQKKLIAGGEACMWGEVVDDTNIISRVWPRASAAAERLWSPQDIVSVRKAARRLEEHTCRMRKRGIMAQPPNGPGYCL